MSEHYYGKGVVGKAVDAFFNVGGSTRDRVKEALVELGAISSSDHLPPEVWDQFQKLMSRSTSRASEAVPGEGTLFATLRLMSNDEIDDLAREIYRLYDNVEQATRDRGTARR